MLFSAEDLISIYCPFCGWETGDWQVSSRWETLPGGCESMGAGLCSAPGHLGQPPVAVGGESALNVTSWVLVVFSRRHSVGVRV